MENVEGKKKENNLEGKNIVAHTQLEIALDQG